MTADAGSEELLTVHVVGLPVGLQVQAQQHADELTRELVLVAEQLHQDGGSGDLPARFVELVTALSGRYAIFTAEQERQLSRAVADGEPTIDLTYTLPASAAAAAASVGEIMDEADDYCREGRLLLTLETPPELVAYRRWFLEQFTEQATGRPPVSWADHVSKVAQP